MSLLDNRKYFIDEILKIIKIERVFLRKLTVNTLKLILEDLKRKDKNALPNSSN